MSENANKKIGYREVLREKEFVKMLAANIINRFGDSIDSIAFTWLVYLLTGSASWSAVIFGINQIPTIFLQPIAGAYIEKKNKKQVMVVTDIIRGLCVLSIAVLFYLELLQPWMLIITSLLISSAEAFRIPASSAVLVQILKKEELDFGISLNSSVSRAVELVGLGLASFIIAQLGIAAAIFIDAVTFAGSALIIIFMDTKEKKQEQGKASLSHYMQLLKEGSCYVRSKKVILHFIILAVVVNGMLVPINSLQAPLVAEVLYSGEMMLSVLSISLSAAMLLSTVLYPYIIRVLSGKKLVFLSGVSIGLYHIILTLIGDHVAVVWLSYVLVAVSSVLAGFSASLLATYVTASFLKLVEPEYIARAAAIMNSAGSSAIPVISFALSIGTGLVTTRNIFIFIGVLLVVLMAVLARVLEIDTEEKE